jgi:hypothetical protein
MCKKVLYKNGSIFGILHWLIYVAGGVLIASGFDTYQEHTTFAPVFIRKLGNVRRSGIWPKGCGRK